MAFCSSCGSEALSNALFCSSCGSSVSSSKAQNEAAPTGLGAASIDLNSKFHITLIVAAGLAVLLLYLTNVTPLIGVATGLAWGLSVRLYFAHKENEFKGTKKLDWVLLIAATTIGFILFLTKDYNVQALLMIFAAVRSLMMYFTMGRKK